MITPEPPREGLSSQQIRIAAVAGGSVVIVGLAVAIGTASGSRPASPRRSASTPPPPAAAGVPPSPSPVVPSPAVSVPLAGTDTPSLVSVSVRWHGRVTVGGPDAHKDLDSVPPRTSDQDSDVTGATFETDLKADSDGVQLAAVGGKPGFAECRDALFANGTDSATDLHDGDVVCLLTSQGRVARLRVLDAAHGFPAATVAADVTVWDPPVAR